MDQTLMQKLAAAEDHFVGSQFMSPVIRNAPVRVRIEGVIVNLRVERPKRFEGWGIFRANSFKTARRVREPSLEEKDRYLKLFPAIRLVVCQREDDRFYGILANKDNRFTINSTVPINLPEDIQVFETVVARFDGAHFWFETIDMSANPAVAVFLQEQLAKETDPDKLKMPGLVPGDRAAYAIAFIRRMELKKDQKEEKIKDALRRANAEFRSYVDRGDTYTVEYIVDGETHRSTIAANDRLDVHTAGICLAGGDRSFDLQSLVAVIRQGMARRGAIYRMDGNRDDNDDYDSDYDD